MNNSIGDVVLGFYVAYDSPPGDRIVKKYGNGMDKKEAFHSWAKEQGLPYCSEFMDNHPTHGAFMGYKLYDVEEKPHPWFVPVSDMLPEVDKANQKLNHILQANHHIFEGDEHARPEFLVDQHKVRNER